MPMVIGWKSPPRFSVDAKMKSDHAQRNANRDTVTIELRLTGRITDRNVRQADAPSIFAAFISSSGMPDMNAVKMSTANGTARVESARMRPGTVSRMPQL